MDAKEVTPERLYRAKLLLAQLSHGCNQNSNGLILVERLRRRKKMNTNLSSWAATKFIAGGLALGVGYDTQ